MMSAPAASVPAGAGPTGPDRDGPAEGAEGASADVGSVVDPLFDAPEPVESPTKKSTLLFQFFLFPLLIVAASVAVFLFFGTIGGGEKTPDEYLKDVVGGGENVQKQAAQQLAVLILRERDRVKKGTIPLEKAFYVSGEFRRSLTQAFHDAFAGRSLDRQRFLALALGAVGDPDAVPALVAHLKDGGDAGEAGELRVSLAAALGNLERPEAVEALAGLASDADVHVANVAVVGLAAVKNDASTTALKAALADGRFEVRVNAAAALARRGVADGLGELEKTLDPAALAGLGLDPSSRQAALANAIRGVFDLKVERLRPRLEALAKDEDPEIQKLVRDRLERWPAPK